MCSQQVKLIAKADTTYGNMILFPLQSSYTKATFGFLFVRQVKLTANANNAKLLSSSLRGYN